MEAVEHIAKETLEQMKEERLTKDQENEESDVWFSGCEFKRGDRSLYSFWREQVSGLRRLEFGDSLLLWIEQLNTDTGESYR